MEMLFVRGDGVILVRGFSVFDSFSNTLSITRFLLHHERRHLVVPCHLDIAEALIV